MCRRCYRSGLDLDREGEGEETQKRNQGLGKEVRQFFLTGSAFPRRNLPSWKVTLSMPYMVPPVLRDPAMLWLPLSFLLRKTIWSYNEMWYTPQGDCFSLSTGIEMGFTL
jgi:hypothetical protein